MRPPQYIEAQEQAYYALRRRMWRFWALWGIASLAAYALLQMLGLVLSLLAFAFILVNLILLLYHRTQIKYFQHYKQIEALFSIYNMVTVQMPLPPMRLWAASPDFLTVILRYVKTYHPMQIVELGSGVSTLLAAYSLKEHSHGQVISLDHESEYSQKSREYVDAHGLSRTAQIIHAPLQEVSVGGQVWQWYDVQQVKTVERIDLLIVDGPPAQQEQMARYPALPLLFDKLNSGAIIICDDFQRPGEQAMVERWLKEFPVDIVEVIDNEKGAVVLRKR